MTKCYEKKMEVYISGQPQGFKTQKEESFLFFRELLT